MSKVAKIKLLSDKAVMPKRATSKSSGFDVTAIDVESEYKPFNVFAYIESRETEGLYELDEGDDHMIKIYKHIFKTGLSIQPPEGYDIKLFPRSSVHKKYAWLANGVGLGDEDYTGEYMFVFYSFSEEPPFEIGDRIGQIVFEKREDIELVKVSELESTERGNGGFGSTGK